MITRVDSSSARGWSSECSALISSSPFAAAAPTKRPPSATWPWPPPLDLERARPVEYDALGEALVVLQQQHHALVKELLAKREAKLHLGPAEENRALLDERRLVHVAATANCRHTRLRLLSGDGKGFDPTTLPDSNMALRPDALPHTCSHTRRTPRGLIDSNKLLLVQLSH